MAVLSHALHASVSCTMQVISHWSGTGQFQKSRGSSLIVVCRPSQLVNMPRVLVTDIGCVYHLVSILASRRYSHRQRVAAAVAGDVVLMIGS